MGELILERNKSSSLINQEFICPGLPSMQLDSIIQAPCFKTLHTIPQIDVCSWLKVM